MTSMRPISETTGIRMDGRTRSEGNSPRRSANGSFPQSKKPVACDAGYRIIPFMMTFKYRLF